MLCHNPPGIPANARLDAILRGGSAHRHRIDRQLWSRPAPLRPAGWHRGPGGHGPDQHDRRRRGKNDDLDAQNAAHAAFAGIRTVTPRSRDGMVESLRALKACRKTAVAARRIALQMIQSTIIFAPDGLRDLLRTMTRMQLLPTL